MNTCPKHSINMTSDNEGFWYPNVDRTTCINCGLCENVCPIINPQNQSLQIISYAAYSKDEAIRIASSSGGLFTIFAENIIESNGMVFGASFDKNFNVIHKYIEKKEDLYEFRGSKYVQSKIGDCYKQTKEFLDIGKMVLFSGTPCQIAGLKSFLRKDYENLICQDIICHGVPSPTTWQKYISYNERKYKTKLKNVSFRQKKYGWNDYSLYMQFQNKTEFYHTFRSDMYLIAFNQSLFLRPCCYNCKYKMETRVSDITIADFWGIKNIVPELDDNKGISLLIINTNKGYDYFQKVSNKINITSVDINEAIKYNQAIIKSANVNPQRNNFFCNMNNYEFDILFNKFCKKRINNRIIYKIRFELKNILSQLGLYEIVKKLLNKTS